MSAPNSTQNHFDFLFLGMGAANSLLLIKLFEAGVLDHKKIGYIDPKPYKKGAYSNDKTFCFWATDAEISQMGVAHLVSASWSEVNVNGTQTSIAPYRYYHIRSEDLFRFSGEVLERLNVCRITDSVEALKTQCHPHEVKSGSGITYTAAEVFDARPPEFLPCKSYQAHLHQSFYGWIVESPQAVFDAATFTMMDFSVPQMESTQFMYVLPFGPNKALVELTRFGEEIITKEQAEPALHAYIEQHFGPVTIQHQEHGVIPMSAATLPNDYMGRHALRTGSRAGRIKPSTGYAFKAMVFDAMRIAENGRKGHFWGFHRPAGHEKGRFAFYDRLLLQVLKKEPNKGSEIFGRLFQRIETPKVLRFLEEKTRLTEEIPILMSLPKVPFIKAAIGDIIGRTLSGIQQNKSVAMAALVGLLYALGLPLIAHVLLLLLLLLVGIPHGALDHVLESKGTKANFSFAFFAKYLGLMALIWVVWQLYAPLGLILFLLYSAWHFGESDFKEMGLKASVFSFSWGIWLLAAVLLTHVSELNAFLPHFDVPEIPVNSTAGGLSIWEWTLAFSAIGIALFSYLNPIYSGLRKVLWILLIGYFLPLLVAFGLYFVGHHSLNGWSHLRKGLSYTNADLWKTAWPFSLGAFALIGGFLWMSDSGVTAYWAQFFVFLSCVSFPHVWEMRKFYAAT